MSCITCLPLAATPSPSKAARQAAQFCWIFKAPHLKTSLNSVVSDLPHKAGFFPKEGKEKAAGLFREAGRKTRGKNVKPLLRLKFSNLRYRGKGSQKSGDWRY